MAKCRIVVTRGGRRLSKLPAGWVQGKQFSVSEVEVVTATVDIDEVVSYRGAISSLQDQASSSKPYPQIHVPFDLCHDDPERELPSSPMQPRYHDPEEEIALGELNRFHRAQQSLHGLQELSQEFHTAMCVRDSIAEEQ